jgi:hypothetical protein
MTAKKIGAGLAALGVIACVGAVHRDGDASFDDGSFLGMISLFCLGIILMLCGLAVAIFGD